MSRLQFTAICVALVIFVGAGSAQTSRAQGTVRAKNNRPSLSVVDTVTVSTEAATSVLTPLRCDSEGNLYLMTEADAVSGIRKFDAKGRQVALFRASAAVNERIAVATFFSLGSDGQLYQLAFTQESSGSNSGVLDPHAFIMVYGSDGKYKSITRLQTEFTWIPSQVAAFPSGDFLVTGLRDDDPKSHIRWPFTGVFSPDGKLLKLVTLVDDRKIHAMAASGDKTIVPSDHPFNNFAVERGTMGTAPDGNVYIMRRLSPALVYAISPGGEVVRRFTVDPGEASYMPLGMQIARGRIAILFREPQTREGLIKVVDLAGNVVATYDIPYFNGSPVLGSAFACYSENPDRFTFLTTTKDERLGFNIAEPR